MIISPFAPERDKKLVLYGLAIFWGIATAGFAVWGAISLVNG